MLEFIKRHKGSLRQYKGFELQPESMPIQWIGQLSSATIKHAMGLKTRRDIMLEQEECMIYCNIKKGMDYVPLCDIVILE